MKETVIVITIDLAYPFKLSEASTRFSKKTFFGIMNNMFHLNKMNV